MILKAQKFIFIVSSIILLILFFSLSFWKIILANSPDIPEGAAQGTNIGVCVDPPDPDLTNPSRPIFRWTTSGNPQTKYWLKVDDSGSTFPSPEINTGEVSSGNNFHQASLGQLPQNKTYWYCVAVSDSFGWTGWTGCNSFFLPNRQPSAKDLAVASDYCTLTANLTWTFDDLDYGDSQTAYQIQIDDNSDFSSPEVDTGKLNFSSQFYLLDLRRLSFNTAYNWRLKVWDTIGPDASNWIVGPSFTTPKHQGPSVDFNWTSGVLMNNDTVLVKFLDNSTVYGGSTESAWLWTFENGTPATAIQKNPSSSFPSSVNQSNVTLKVTDSDNYSCQTTKVVDVVGLRNKLKEIIPR
jgi:hypothetical protein